MRRWIAFSLFVVCLANATGTYAQAECDGPFKGKKPTKEELAEILKLHAEWSRDRYPEGDDRRMNLCGANLRWADFRNANLVHANLSQTDLREANLSGASVTNANLSGANLNSADLLFQRKKAYERGARRDTETSR